MQRKSISATPRCMNQARVGDRRSRNTVSSARCCDSLRAWKPFARVTLCVVFAVTLTACAWWLPGLSPGGPEQHISLADGLRGAGQEARQSQMLDPVEQEGHRSDSPADAVVDYSSEELDDAALNASVVHNVSQAEDVRPSVPVVAAPLELQQPGSAVVLIARSLESRIQASAALLRRHGFEVHVIIDSPLPPPAAGFAPSPWVHYLPDAELRAAGFLFLTGRFELAATAWDRALLWASRYGRSRLFWLVEEDVAWQPASALPDLMRRLDDEDPGADLISRSHQGGPSWSPRWVNWQRPRLSLPPQSLYSSFNPLCRLSRRMLDAVAALAAQHGRLAYNEFLFASLARAQGMRLRFFDLERDGVTIRYRPPFDDAGLRRLAAAAARGGAQGGAIVHPVKHWPHAFQPRPGNFSAAELSPPPLEPEVCERLGDAAAGQPEDTLVLTRW